MGRRNALSSFGAGAASYANMSRVFSTRSMGGAARSSGTLSKLESIASTAVRAADKVKASIPSNPNAPKLNPEFT